MLATESDPPILVEEIRKYDTETLIKFLKKQEIKLNNIHFDILNKEEVIDYDFINFSQKKLKRWKMPNELSKDSLKEVLAKYGIKMESKASCNFY
ncbi:hypothetical protein C1645_840268 [Glomus cerebriforme]|uniref:SAM domain-containing protein n=1 Tax=Glomus cerebriforme TaxID=658196 RepID=A0A397SBB5_9GLOM|nr:hypothetical protein C1645_840268 [Glomus cerebriforme]